MFNWVIRIIELKLKLQSSLKFYINFVKFDMKLVRVSQEVLKLNINNGM